MVLIHQWLQDAENLPHDDSEYATIHPMASYIKNVWLHTQLFCVPDTKAHLRFENLMAYWFGLLLHCACVEKYTLRLCSALKAEKKHTILFPEFEIFRSEDRDMDPPSQLIDCADRVIHFKYKLSEGKADKNRASCNDHYTIMNTAYGDTAQDLLLWIDKKLIVVQCKLRSDALVQKEIDDILEKLTKYRGVLWFQTTPDGGVSLPVASNLGLPEIVEKDVMFVLLSTGGLTEPAKSAFESCTGFKRRIDLLTIPVFESVHNHLTPLCN